MFLDPQFWVAVAFILFIAAIFNPVRKILTSSLDSQIDEIKNKINESENLKKDAEKALSELKLRQQEVQKEIKALNDKLDSFRIATASQYLGHSVLVPGNVVRANGNDNIDGVIDVPNATTKLQVFFQKENGEILEQLDLGSQSRGLVGFSWENIPEEIKNNNEKVFISAFLGDNPDQALATSVFSKVMGTSTENNEIKLEVDGYGLIDASKAVRFRN